MAGWRSSLMAMRQILIVCLIVAALLRIDAGNAQVLHFRNQTGRDQCDIFQGKWVSNPSQPPYSESCPYMRNVQNCLKNGRPDKEYLHWRWKPYGCDIPPFNPKIFLNAMTDKAFAIVGDSVSRNQRESLMCLLSKFEEPVPVQSEKTGETWLFPSYNFTLAFIWSPCLLKIKSKGPDADPLWLHQDILDSSWTELYHNFDYFVFGIGPWFVHRIYLLENDTVVGCHGCGVENVTEVGLSYPYRRALNSVFRFISTTSHKPFVVYRIHAPNHFEHGYWYNGGNCNRTVPFREGEFAGSKNDSLFRDIGREEFANAVANAPDNNGVHLEILDIYHLSLLRPDGHPDNHRPDGKHDCLHWCMPGVIDTWNDLMMEMVLRNEDLRHSS